jgi:hypothetical protein
VLRAVNRCLPGFGSSCSSSSSGRGGGGYDITPCRNKAARHGLCRLLCFVCAAAQQQHAVHWHWYAASRAWTPCSCWWIHQLMHKVAQILQGNIVCSRLCKLHYSQSGLTVPWGRPASSTGPSHFCAYGNSQWPRGLAQQNFLITGINKLSYWHRHLFHIICHVCCCSRSSGYVVPR